MKVYTHNFNPNSNSGPNKFTRQLFKNLTNNKNITVVNDQNSADIEFCLIQQAVHKTKPMVLRLDGIYFNSEQDYKNQNAPIKFSYDNADAVIFQSSFNKNLIEHWFGPHKNGHVIHNAADLKLIEATSIGTFLSYDAITYEVWSCASSWRPHKRLKENIRYFIENAPKEAILYIAGQGTNLEELKSYSGELLGKRIFYIGNLDYPTLIKLYKISTVFLHLAYLDHCPNVVVDAHAAGCHIVCASSGGTKEIVKNHGTIIQEDNWDYSPIPLYKPPKLDFDNFKVVSNSSIDKLKNINVKYDNIEDCAQKYLKVMEGVK